jgi:PAS domain S-box-containing protein
MGKLFPVFRRIGEILNQFDSMSFVKPGLFRDISITKKLYFVIGIMAFLIAAELIMLFFTIRTLSATRAYVGAEGLLSKAQRDAVSSLKKYGQTHDEAYYRNFIKLLDVPLGDKQARMELEKEKPDMKVVYDGFIRGRNHVEDIEGMIKLFRRFRNLDFMDRTIAAWSEADSYIDLLREKGMRLHRQMQIESLPQKNIDRTIAEIDVINEKLTVLQDRFSATLGQGSREMEKLILQILFIVAITVELTGLFLTVSISAGITRGIYSITAVAEQIARSNYGRRVKIYSNDELGRLAHVFNKMADDLEKRRKEEIEIGEKLVEQAHRLNEAQQLAKLGSWEWDLVTNEVTWSSELKKIYGWNNSEVPRHFDAYKEQIHPEDKDKVEKMIERTLKKGMPFDLNHRIKTNDKSVRMLHARGEIMTSADGKPIKMRGTAQDITEKFHEQELEKLVLAATQSFNSVIIVNRKGEIEWVNEGFEKLTGYTLSDVQNTHGELLRNNNETAMTEQANFYETIIREKAPITYEGKNYTKDGREVWVITTLTPVLDKNGEVERIIAIDSDITLRKQMEEKLLQANEKAELMLIKGNKAISELTKAKKQLEESMSVKEQFLANMSHEIRTPMNAIVGFTDVILKTELNPEQKQYVEAIKTSGENLLVIINDILDFSKLQSGKFVFEQIELRLSQVVSMLLEVMLHKSIEKNIRLSTKIDKRIPDNLIGDPTRLNQILLNLVGNAIKFTEKGEVKILIDLVEDLGDEVEIKFSVIDTGIGIPANKLSTIFEGFTQASNETTRKYGGTGLGLSIAKQLVELQGGKIDVESKLGEGSKFHFQIKLKKSSSPAVKKRMDTEEGKTEYLAGLKILLVEDNEFNQILAKKVLTDWKWEVDVAENGLVALDRLRQKDYDVILMDIQLPEMDGYEAANTIRNTFPAPKKDTAIIAMTAHALTGEAEKCFSAGMNEYISKPFDRHMLYSKILSVVKENR